jgi:hypothetical protein
MANLVVNNLPYFVQGDGASTTAAINLGFSPISTLFVQALITNSGVDVTANVTSVVVVGQIATVTFVAGFSYLVTIILDILPVLPLLSGSVQVSTPWVMTGQGTAGTPDAKVVTVQGISGGTVVPVVGPTLTKGTQGATGFSTQDLKDSGRTQVTLYVDSISGITTEALATLNITKGAVAQATATSYTVTAGKTLRLQSFSLSGNPPNNTQFVVRARVRTAASAIAVTSPIIIHLVSPGATNVSFTGEPACIGVADGLEIAGGTQIAISHVSSSAVVGSTTTGAGVSFCLIGYEY